jgi:putative DNA primase/helicase
MITNHKPRVPGDDDALWRRIRIVPFDVVVEQPDATLPERLREELPGVLAWLVAGYREYAEHGLTAPAGVTRVTESYRNASDALGRFLDERTTTNANAYVGARQLYGEWANWCHANGEEAGSEVTFAEAMTRKGHEKKRSSAGQVYRGIGVLAREGETL